MAAQAGGVTQTAIREYRKENFVISTDPSRLDVDAIHAFLSRSSYWAKGIPKETVERSIRGSLCFGVYDGNRQIGFARVVTDGATYAFLCDDYILESYRGRGLGKWLMQCIFSHPDLQTLQRWTLLTQDVRLYEKFGFKPLKNPEEYMELVSPQPYGSSATSRG